MSKRMIGGVAAGAAVVGGVVAAFMLGGRPAQPGGNGEAKAATPEARPTEPPVVPASGFEIHETMYTRTATWKEEERDQEIKAVAHRRIRATGTVYLVRLTAYTKLWEYTTLELTTDDALQLAEFCENPANQLPQAAVEGDKAIGNRGWHGKDQLGGGAPWTIYYYPNGKTFRAYVYWKNGNVNEFYFQPAKCAEAIRAALGDADVLKSHPAKR